MSHPLFSVIMPTYNRSAVIGPVIEAILSQSITDFELIIVDDGSTDNTLEMLSSYKDERIRVLTQNNNRQTQARRKACTKANGKYFAFCDSDDVWDTDYLKSIYSVFVNYSADYVFTNYIVEGEDKKRINLDVIDTQKWLSRHGNLVDQNTYSFDDLYTALIEYQPIFCSCQALSKDHYQRIGGISEKINNKKLGTVQTSEDSHIIRRSAITDKAYFIDQTMVKLGRQGDNTSHSFTSNLRGGLNVLLDIDSNTVLKEAHRTVTQKAIREHREELCKQVYYYEPPLSYISHYWTQPKFELTFKNHAHFLYSLGKHCLKVTTHPLYH